MGKRTWFFSCNHCNERFGKWFEHMSKKECLDWLEELSCPECSGKNIIFTGETTFSNINVSEDESLVFRCYNCISNRTDQQHDIYLDVTNKNINVIKKEIQKLSCKNCHKQELKLTDSTETITKEV